jgi:hypothetical protein
MSTVCGGFCVAVAQDRLFAVVLCHFQATVLIRNARRQTYLPRSTQPVAIALAQVSIPLLRASAAMAGVVVGYVADRSGPACSGMLQNCVTRMRRTNLDQIRNWRFPIVARQPDAAGIYDYSSIPQTNYSRNMSVPAQDYPSLMPSAPASSWRKSLRAEVPARQSSTRIQSWSPRTDGKPRSIRRSAVRAASSGPLT